MPRQDEWLPQAPPIEQPAPAPFATVRSGPSHQELQAQIAKHEADMRSPEHSEPWRDYWMRGGSAACLDARRALETADMTQVTAEPAL